MNFTTMFCKRLNVKELVTNVPVLYGSVTGNIPNFPAIWCKLLVICSVYGIFFRWWIKLDFKRWATKKTAGSTKNGRDSKPKNLGVKKFGGERVIPGNIIVRQRGTRFHPGNCVGMGKDHTLYALKEGNVKFETHKLSGRKWVHVEPEDGFVLHPVYAKTTAASTQPNTTAS